MIIGLFFLAVLLQQEWCSSSRGRLPLFGQEFPHLNSNFNPGFSLRQVPLPERGTIADGDGCIVATYGQSSSAEEALAVAAEFAR